MLDELDQPSPLDGIEKGADICVKHPVHLPPFEPHRQCVQRVMRAASWPEPVGETKEVDLVDGVEHRDGGELHDLVLQRWYAKRSLPPILLRDVRPPDRLRPVRSPLQPPGEVPEVLFQVLAVLLPRHPIHSGRRLWVQPFVGLPQRLLGVDQVRERLEPHTLIPTCCLAYPLPRTVHVFPARRPERVLRARVPVGRGPSLHCLLHRLPGFVRQLLRYSGPVRLPVLVHLGLAPFGFPSRPAAPSAAGEHGTSRFPCEALPGMRGVSDRAGTCDVSPWRRADFAFRIQGRRRLPEGVISRLNTRPARSPVNASPRPLRAAAHDSRSAWLARPSPYGTCIRCTSPVSRRTLGPSAPKLASEAS